MPATIARTLFWLTSILIALLSLRIFALGMEAGFPHMSQHFGRAAIFWTHVLAASLALVLMPFQFWTRLRNQRPAVHRWTGRTYVTAVLFGGLSGMMLAPDASTGKVAAAGFFMLSVLWLAATALAFQRAWVRDIPAHRRWMARSAALTFAAVTLRAYIPLSFALGIPFETAYPVIAWACWLPNLAAVEWWRMRKGRA